MKSLSYFLFLMLINASIFSAVFQKHEPYNTKNYITEYFFPNKVEKENILVFQNAGTILNKSVEVRNYTKHTMLKGSFIFPTVDLVKKIIDRYKNIPGGITFENPAVCINNISNINFLREKEAFSINDNLIYKPNISFDEMKAIYDSVGINNNVGVSLGKNSIVYGELKKDSIPVIYMKMADHFLGSVVFANNSWIKYQKFPNNYKPKKDFSSSGIYAVYFNFNRVEFLIENKNYKPKEIGMQVTLIPLTNKKNEHGGLLPNFEMIKKGNISKIFQRNIEFVLRNTDYFEKDVRINKVIKYGQLIAFFRYLNKNNIKVKNF